MVNIVNTAIIITADTDGYLFVIFDLLKILSYTKNTVIKKIKISLMFFLYLEHPITMASNFLA